MQQGPSTLIVEKRFLGKVRFWWTEEDVLARSPFPPTRGEEFWFPGGGTQNPFREWCYYHYLSHYTGKALLASLPTGKDKEDFSDCLHRSSSEKSPPAWKAAYPELQVVVTGFNANSRKTAEVFARVLGSGGDESVPRLAMLLQGKDRHLRRLAVRALRMIGPRAHAAMPALIERLYHGLSRERLEVADALAIGSDAIERLREASSRDDPWVRCPADNAVAKLGLLPGSPQSFIRQYQKGFIPRERFFYLFMQHLTRENVGEVLASTPEACLKVLKAQVKSWPPELEIVLSQQSREGMKVFREYLAGRE
jgi:hypothetical protein